jgi:hypothetical protein
MSNSVETDQIKKRPLSVTFLASGVLFFGVFTVLGLWNSVQLLWIHPSFLSQGTILYLIVRGVILTLFSVILGVSLWRGITWAPLVARWSVIILVLWYWLEEMVLINPDFRGDNLLFMAAVTVFIILFPWWVLSRPPSRAFFGEKHD